MGSSENRLKGIIENYAVLKIPGIKEKHLKELYEAKCKDLVINPTKDHERRFFEYCLKTIGNRKITLREQGLGSASAVALGKMIAGNENFSHLDIGKNNFGNHGLSILMQRGLRANCTLVHLDIGSNDVTDEGCIKLFKLIETHPTLTSLVVANHDRLHRNRMNDRSCQALGELLAKN